MSRNLIHIFNKKFKTEEFNKIFINFSWLFSDKIIKYGFGGIIGIAVAKYLGPEVFGVFSYAMVFSSFFGVLVSLGLRNILVRELVLNTHEPQKLLGSSFYLMLLSGFLFFILCPFIFYLYNPHDQLTLILIIIFCISFLFQSFEVISAIFEAKTSMKKVVWISNISFVICASIKILCIYFSASLYWFAIATTLELALASLFLLFIFPKNNGSLLDWNYNRQTAKSLLRDSLPIIVSAIAVKIFSDIDLIMIKDLYSKGETGLYALAVKISRIWAFVPSAIFVSVFPNLLQTKKINEELYYNKLQKLYNLVTFLSYSVAIFFTLTSPLLIEYFLGPEYFKSSAMLIVLIWSILFSSLGGARTLFLISENKTRIYMLTVVVGCILNIILNYIFIPIYGAIEACYTTLFTTFFTATGINFFIRSLQKTGIMQLKSFIYPKFW